MTVPTYSVQIGPGPNSLNAVTGDAMRVVVDRRVGNVFQKLRPGKATVTLDNESRDYSPSNSASALVQDGSIRPQSTVIIQATWAGSTYPLFCGQIQEIKQEPLIKDRSVSIVAEDNARALQDAVISTTLFTDTQINSIAAAVLVDAGVNSFSIDDLNDISPFATFERRDALNAIMEIVEAGFYNAYVGADGVFNLKTRYWDQEGVAGSGTTSYTNLFYKLDYALNDDDVINKAQIRGVPREVLSVSTVAWSAGVIAVPASSHVSFFLDYVEPTTLRRTVATSMVTPVTSADFLANTASGGGGSDVTSAVTVDTTFFAETAVTTVFNATGATAYLNKFQLQGSPIPLQPLITSESNVASSQALYGVKAFALTNDLIAGQTFLQNYADFITARQHDPVPRIQPSWRNEFPDVLERDLGNVLSLVEDETGINGKFTVTRMSHDISGFRSGVMHTLRLGVDNFRNQDVLILDDPAYGLLDERKLGL
jgi:hypothetical protein